MYRNYFGRGTDQSLSDNSSGSGSSTSTFTQSTSTVTTQHQQPQQKYPGTGSSQFVPSLNAITSNQNLQWLVQPSVFSMPGPSRAPPRAPYPLPTRLGSVNPQPTKSHFFRPGIIRAAAVSRSPTRCRNDEHLSAEELERRRVRRERNKLAAAKCRNRRRELTDTLQNETDQLEDKKSCLQKEIAELQKEKEKLELVLEAHRPICKVQDSDSDSDSNILPTLGGIKIEAVDSELPGPSQECKIQTKQEKPKPKITIPPPPTTSTAGTIYPELDSLHTPVLISTPTLTPFTASLVFTYPTTSLDTSAPTTSQPLSLAASYTSQHAMSQATRNPEPCAIAHRRSSSSGDQSDQSLNSPTLLTL